MSRRRRLSGIACLLCAASAAVLSRVPPARAQTPAPAPAQDASSLFAVVAAPEDRFGQRVLAELLSLGFQSVRLDPPAEPVSRASLEVAARAAGALAAIRAAPSARGVEVWIADRVTGKTVLRELPIDPAAPDPESALAIRAVELLRASLLEASLPAPPPGEVPVPPAVRAKLALPPPPAPPPPPPTLRVAVSLGMLASPGGFAPSAALHLGLTWMPFEHVGVTAFASLPLSRPRVENAVGSTDLAAFLGGGGARFLFTGRASAWAPSVDVGLTAIAVQLTGSANEGYAAGDAGASTAAPYLRAGVAFAAHSMLRVRADVLFTAIFQGASVQLAGQEAATFGAPIVVASAGVDFGWF